MLLISLSSCQTAKNTLQLATELAIWSPLIILNLPFLPFQLLFDDEESEEANGIIKIQQIPHSKDYLIIYREGLNQHFYKANFESQTKIPITEGDSFNFSPQVSSDGTKIIFVQARGPKKKVTKIYEINLDSGAKSLLVDTKKIVANPAYLIGNKSFVYSEKNRKFWHLYRYDLPNLKRTQITNGKYMDFAPMPLSDGRHLMFYRAHTFRNMQPYDKSYWIDYDFYMLDLTDNLATRLRNENRNRRMSYSRITDSDALMLEKNYMAPMADLDQMENLREKFGKKMSAMTRIDTVHIVPDSSLQKAFYVVVRLTDNGSVTEIYLYDFISDDVRLISEFPTSITLVWPKLNEEQNTIFFKSNDRYKIYELDLNTNTRHSLVFDITSPEGAEHE